MDPRAKERLIKATEAEIVSQTAAHQRALQAVAAFNDRATTSADSADGHSNEGLHAALHYENVLKLRQLAQYAKRISGNQVTQVEAPCLIQFEAEKKSRRKRVQISAYYLKQPAFVGVSGLQFINPDSGLGQALTNHRIGDRVALFDGNYRITAIK